MKLWGIAFILFGIGGILAAIFNRDAWFRVNSAGGRMVQDAFGRQFARLLNVGVGIPLILLGIADVTDQLPLSEYMNIWLFEDARSIVAAGDYQQQSPAQQQPAGNGDSGLSPYSP